MLSPRSGPFSRSSVPVAAVLLLLASGSASAALVQVTITGTFTGTDHYSNTWPSVLSTQSVTPSAITNQAYTARIVYETSILTPARDAYAQTNLGNWDNITNFGTSQLYESFVVSSEMTMFGQTLAIDSNFGSALQAYDYASGTETFILSGSDIHGPGGDTVDNEHIMLNINKVGLFPVPFVANEVPASPLALVLSASGGNAWIDLKLYDYPGCKTLSTTYSVPAVRNCPAERFTDQAVHWVDGSGTVSSVTISQVVPLPGALPLLISALASLVVPWYRRGRRVQAFQA